MENTRDSKPPAFDPQRDLALLERSKKTATRSSILDFGPLWFAPALATVMTGFGLFGESASVLTNVAYMAAGIAAVAATAIHQKNQHRVRTRFSKNGLIGVIAIMAISWLIHTGYSMVLNSMGYDDFVVLPAVLAWLAVTAIYLVIRQACYALLARHKTLG